MENAGQEGWHRSLSRVRCLQASGDFNPFVFREKKNEIHLEAQTTDAHKSHAGIL